MACFQPRQPPAFFPPGPPPAFFPPGPPPAFFPPGPPPAFFPSGPPPHFCQPGPPPARQARVTYKYWTPLGEAPGDAKPPSLPAQSSTGSVFLPQQLGGFNQYQPHGPAPFQQQFTCYPTPNVAPPGPARATWFAANAPMALVSPPISSQTAPQMAAPRFRAPDGIAPGQEIIPPAPGNRVNDETVKTSGGAGYLVSEENSTFHVIHPGYNFPTTAGYRMDKGVQFTVQLCDSTATVQKLILRLGGLNLLGGTNLHLGNVAIEEWHEKGHGVFEKGTRIYYGEERALCRLKDIGWGAEHGQPGKLPPIWVMLCTTTS